MQYGRLISFSVCIIGGSLLQLWALVLVLKANGHHIELVELLGDGGLFFFSTSLAVGSAISLFDNRPLKVGSLDFNITILTLSLLLITVLIYYSTVLSSVTSVLSEYSNVLENFTALIKSGGITAIQNNPNMVEMLTDENFINIFTNKKPFSKHVFLQIGCALVAIGFWFFAGLRTGLFVKDSDDA